MCSPHLNDKSSNYRNFNPHGITWLAHLRITFACAFFFSLWLGFRQLTQSGQAKILMETQNIFILIAFHVDVGFNFEMPSSKILSVESLIISRIKSSKFSKNSKHHGTFCKHLHVGVQRVLSIQNISWSFCLIIARGFFTQHFTPERSTRAKMENYEASSCQEKKKLS